MNADTKPGAEKRQIGRYLLVGGCAVAIDAGSYFALTAAGLLEPGAAKRTSFILGAAWGYFANKFYTFRQTGFSVKEPLWFAAVYLAGWMLNSLSHDLVLRVTGLRSLSLLVATGVSTCSNFAGQKWIVFRAASQRPSEPNA